MEWRNIEEMVAELGLDSDPCDTKSIQREIKLRMRDVHPDRSSNTQKPHQNDTEIRALSSALTYVRRQGKQNRGIVLFSDKLEEMDRKISIIQKRQESDNSTSRSAFLGKSQESIHELVRLPRISSGIFSAICGGLFLFSSSFANHPLLGPILNTPWVYSVLLVLLAFFCLAFVSTWLVESAIKERRDLLLSESGRRIVIASFFHELNYRGLDNDSAFNVTRLSEAVASFLSINLYYGFWSKKYVLPLSFSEEIARIYIGIMSDRELIKKMDAPSLEDRYVVDEQLLSLDGDAWWLYSAGESLKNRAYGVRVSLKSLVKRIAHLLKKVVMKKENS